jgi:PAS domain S-box-containing protein
MKDEGHSETFFTPSFLVRNVLWIAGAALIYFSVARLSLLLIFEPEGIAAIWPPSGIFLSAILLTRRELRPWLVGALFITDFIAEMLAGTPGIVSLFYALILTGDAVLSTWLILRFVGEPITFRRVRELVAWLLLSVVLSNALASLAAAVVSQALLGASFWKSWQEWMASDGVGNLIITPLILSWAAWGRTRWGDRKIKRALEATALFILLVLFNYLAFSLLTEYSLFSLLLTYLTFPFLLWAALRFEVCGLAFASVIMAAIAIYYAFNGHFINNILYQDSPLDTVITVQLYLAFMVAPAIFLATTVAERRQFEEALGASEDKFKHMFEYSNVGKSITQVSGEKSANRALCEMLGYSREELQSHKWQEITHPDDIELTQRVTDALLSGEKDAARFTKRYLHKNGSVVWGDVSTSVRWDEAGKPLYFMTTIIDNTERVQAEEMLRDSEELFRDSFYHSGIGRAHAEPMSGRFLRVNPAFCEFTGYTEGELLQKTLIELTFPEDRESTFSLFRRLALQEIRTFMQEKRFIRKDGAIVWANVSVDMLFDDEGHPMIGTAVIQDITERKQAEQKLKEYSEHLEEMVEARTRELREAQEQLIRQEKLAVLGQLAGGVGHELRNPLSVINSAVYYLKLVQPEASDKIRQYHAMIEQEVHNAEKIINDLLDFARLGSVDRESVNILGLVKRVLERFPAPACVEVSLDLPEGLPKVFADPRQMEQVLGNLVVNAYQAMREGGGLTISAHQQMQMVAIIVKDSGVGISSENMQKLFEPLFTTKAKGIGLGLAVSKKLVEANGGRIEVSSEPGRGSTFMVYLPVDDR